MLLHHHFQFEHLPNVWQDLAQNLVSVCLQKCWKRSSSHLPRQIRWIASVRELSPLHPKLIQTSVKAWLLHCTHSYSFHRPAVLFAEDADGFLQCILSLLHIGHFFLIVHFLLPNPRALSRKHVLTPTPQVWDDMCCRFVNSVRQLEIRDCNDPRCSA